MNRTPALFAGVEPLEVFAELLAELDGDSVISSRNDVPWAPTTTARRRGRSAMKIAARRIVVSRQIASQIRS